MSTPAPTREVKIRYVAPDMARGIALLGIALANIGTAWALTNSADYANYFGGIFGPGTVVDKAAVVFAAMFVHVRGMPMFATLLGFGVGLIAMSLWRRQFPLDKAKRVLWRRYGWLALFGIVHMLLIFFGDVMFAYGVCAMVVAAMIGLKDRTLMVIAWCMLGAYLIFTIGSSVAMLLYPDAMAFDTSYLIRSDSVAAFVRFNLLGALGQAVMLPLVMLMIIPLILIGFVWARRGVLTNVDEHLSTLRAWMLVTVVVIMIIGLPWGLAAIGVLPENLEPFLMTLNSGFGLLTGPGILAAITLATHGIQQRIDAARARGEHYQPSPPVVAITALGKRSMSGYLFQSILFVIFTQPFMLGWGIDVGIVKQMGIAFLIWVITVVAAYVFELAGWQGPFERLHRRLSYGKEGLPQRYPTAVATS